MALGTWNNGPPPQVVRSAISLDCLWGVIGTTASTHPSSVVSVKGLVCSQQSGAYCCSTTDSSSLPRAIVIQELNPSWYVQQCGKRSDEEKGYRTFGRCLPDLFVGTVE